VDEDPFSRELRAARARIAELQRRQGAAGGSSRRLLPEALAEVDVALEELAVTGQELREQTAELAVAREALEAERERYQELFQSAVLATVAVVADRQGGVRALRWLVRDPAGTGGPEPLLVVSIDQAIRQAEARRRQLEALADLDPVENLDGAVQAALDAGIRLLRVDGTACTLLDGERRLSAIGATDEAGSAFARAQEHLAEGPGPDACAGDRPVWSSDLPADLRWSRLQPAAAVNRAGAVVAVPVRLYGGPIGVCLGTSASPRPWTDADVEAAEAYAVMLAGLLEVAAEARRSATFARRVQEALERPAGEADDDPP
jgi:hypothetical protein